MKNIDGDNFMSDRITGAALIGNSDVAPGQKTLIAYNPATSATLTPEFRNSSEEDIARACDLAWNAFDRYRQLPIETRAAFLDAIAEEIDASQAAVIERAGAESGLPEGRLKGEFARTLNQLRLFAQTVRDGEWLDLRIDSALPDRQPLARPDLRMRQIPLGPVAVFGSSNFPLAFSVAGGDTASALAAGCPVVVKGHPAHLGTGELIARAIRSAAERMGMPEGVFSYLPGEIASGTALVKNPKIKAVGFTGSRRGGLALVALASARPEPIPVYAEMSSVNPVFVMPQAIEKRAAAIAKGYAASLTLGAGQYCTSPGLMFVQQSAGLSAFLQTLEAELGAHQPAPMLTSGIHAAYEAGRDALAAHDGVSAAAESQPPAGPNRGRAAVFKTDVKSFLANPELSQEIFGSASLLIICDSVDEMRDAAEQLEGQLTATLHLEPEDVAAAGPLIPVLERRAGRILANGWPTGVEVSHAMVHGGPFPATSDSSTTSVGTLAIRRFLRPVCYQDMPQALLPAELQPGTLEALPHLVDGKR